MTAIGAFFPVMFAVLGIFDGIDFSHAADNPTRIMTTGEDHTGNTAHSVTKRYVAALAKNNRLPSFMHTEKKEDRSSSSESGFLKEDEGVWSDDEQHTGTLLKAYGEEGKKLARTMEGFYDQNYDYLSDEAEKSPSPNSMTSDKRNVAALARLGRLNAVRYARLQPHYVSGKRINSDESAVSENDEDNEIDILNDSDCDDNEDDNQSWKTKRYVAALARSGRLPVWHPQRMWWGGKRDTPTPYWLRSGARGSNDKRENQIDELAFEKPKNKRCKMFSKYPEVSSDKRNIAALARKGKLPFRSYRSG